MTSEKLTLEASNALRQQYKFLARVLGSDDPQSFFGNLVSESESEWLYYIIDTLRKGQANLLMRCCTEAM
jgi:hypothetical protein